MKRLDPSKLLGDYGMVLALLVLCAFFSAMTISEQVPTGKAVEKALLSETAKHCSKEDAVLLLGAANQDTGALTDTMETRLKEAGYVNTRKVVGTPRDVRLALDALQKEGKSLKVIIAAGDVTTWAVVERIPETHPDFAAYRMVTPPKPKMWPTFLKRSNLMAIVNKIVVIAIIAIGMTMVIITAGIDLSVGSLIALAAVIATVIMKQLGGAEAPAWTVAVGFLVAILSCGLVGAFGGYIVARFKVPSFITTLAFMLMARGLARKITGGHSIDQLPEALTWLGRGSTLGIPNTVLLLIILYVGAHLFMSHTRMGRFIYAVGGNEQAARLSGVPVRWVIIFVFMISGLTAGLGGCIQASQIDSGTPNIAVMYELYVIAAVVVGGTSLAGGSGRIYGTLIGAFIIAVIQNGMNLLGMQDFDQMIVLGAVILGAVLLDKLRTSVSLHRIFAKQLKTNAS